MAIFYFVSFFVFQLLWDFDNFLFDLVYPFLAIIITSISSFHMWHNTTTVRGSINFYLYVNFSYSYSRRFIHYLVYLSRLTSEKGKNFSKDTKWQWWRGSSTATLRSSMPTSSLIHALFPRLSSLNVWNLLLGPVPSHDLTNWTEVEVKDG